MEVPVTQGLLTLIATLFLWAIGFIALTLLFNTRVRAIGLLLLLLALSLAASLATFLSWKYQSGNGDVEGLLAALLVPLFGVSISLLLAIQYIRQKSSKLIKKELKNAVAHNSLLSVKVLVITILLTELFSQVTDIEMSLVIPFALAALVAIFWEPLKRLMKS